MVDTSERSMPKSKVSRSNIIATRFRGRYVLGRRESGLFYELPSNSDAGSPVSEKNPLLRLNE
jgi:hypothetical protein